MEKKTKLDYSKNLDADILETSFEYAGTVAEWLMVTNNNDYRKCISIAENWSKIEAEEPPYFKDCLFDMLRAIHARKSHEILIGNSKMH